MGLALGACPPAATPTPWPAGGWQARVESLDMPDHLLQERVHIELQGK